jgi:pheromone shutdown protein TraB
MSDREKSAIERAKEYGIDVTLLESSLKLTVDQRIRRLQQWIIFQEEIKKVRTQLYPECGQHDEHRRVAEDSGT